MIKRLKFFLPLFFIIVALSPAKADRAKRALKALDKHKIEKAEKLVVKALEKDTTNLGAHYVFSLLYVTEYYERYNIDSAYTHINQAIALYDSLEPEDKRLKKLNKWDVNDSTLQKQKATVEALAFEHVTHTHTIEAYNFFLQYYTTAQQTAEVTRLRNALAFAAARRINTYDAYKNFIDTYPNATELDKASELYEFLLYENKTKSRRLDSYISFLKEYPNTNYTADALENIFELYTIDNKPSSYTKFAQDYPGNNFSAKSINYLYHIIKDQQGIAFFEKHYGRFVSDSLKAIIALDKTALFPIYENGLYGFKNSLGKKVIAPRYTAIEEDYLCGDIPADYLLVTNQNIKQIVSHQGTPLFHHDNNMIAPLNDGLLLIGKMGKYGLWHVSGYIVAETAYDTLYLLNRQYIKYKEKNKWGLMSYTGKRVAAALYDDIFIEGSFVIFERQGQLAIANDRLLFQMANQESPAIAFDFEDVVLLDSNMILGIDGEEETVINSNLNTVIPKEKQTVYRLQEGWLIKKNGKFRFYSEDMIPLSSAGYDEASYKMNWLALKKDNKWALLDQRENTFPTFQYDSLNLISADFVLAKSTDTTFLLFQDKKRQQLNKSATVQVLRTSHPTTEAPQEYLLVKNPSNYKILFNSRGEQIIAGQYNDISPIGSAFFITERNGKKGLIDSLGKVLLTQSYDGIGNYAGGYITTLKGQKFGLFNPVNNVEINPQYDITVKVYNDSLFIAAKRNQLGLIDKNNKEILPFQFDTIDIWNDSLAIVKMNDQWHIYNILNKKPVLEGISALKYVINGEAKQAIILKNNQYGLISNEKLVLLSPAYDDILSLRNKENPIYFAEKRVKEAGIFVVVYFNEKGEAIHQQTFSEKDYDNIYCY